MPLPTPHGSESESDFVSRCDEALATEFPETAQRNAVCYKQWRESKGESREDKKALDQFPPDKYAKRENIPLFPEHVKELDIEDPSKPGKFKRVNLKYDKAVLETIIEKNNARIRDTGSFSPLVKGHTSDDGDSREEPEVLGYSGPFRLGVIGDEDKRYAIFADEWHRIDKADDLDSRRRRSVEVHIGDPDKSNWFIDPIAALGATTPELDCGIARYAKEPSGEMVLRYQMAGCAASPSGSNTFIPSSGLKKKKDLNQMEPAMDEDTIVKKCVEAVAAMLPKLLDDIAAKKEAEAAAMVERNAMEEENDMPVDKNAHGEGEAAQEEAAVEETREGEEARKTEIETAKYQRQIKIVEDRLTKELKDKNARIAKMEKQMQEFQQQAADASRESQIQTLRQTRAFDEDKYLGKCLYSRGGTMTDEQFSDLVSTIEDLSPEIPVGRTLPRAIDPNTAADKDKNARNAKALAICNAAIAKGEHVPWEAAWEQAAAK